MKQILLALIFAIAPLGAAQALMLDNWNDGDIQSSGDYVDAQINDIVYDGKTVTSITLSWVEADDTDSLSAATGLDTVFYNSAVEVQAVFENSVVTSNDVTDDWKLNFGGTTAGGDFGSFLSKKVLEGGGTGGIDPNSLIFVLADQTTLSTNSSGSTIAAHVRYGDDNCSGWVSDGGRPSLRPSGACGGSSAVPEPTAALVFGAGLLSVSFASRSRKTS